MRSILQVLGNIRPGPATNVARVCHDLAETIKARGMVILISDLLDGGADADGAGTADALLALRHFRHRKHDVIVFHLLDDSEIDLPFDELSNFRDVESGARLAVDPAVFRNIYRRRVQAFIDDFRQGCTQTSIDYKLVRTSQPIEAVLSEYLHFRARRSR